MNNITNDCCGCKNSVTYESEGIEAHGSCIDNSNFDALELVKEESKEVVEKPQDVVKEPPHYKHGKFETIDEMLIVFGPQKTFDFCILNSWKYRARAPFKEKMEQDMEKADQYLIMAKEIADAYRGVEGYNFQVVNLIKGE